MITEIIKEIFGDDAFKALDERFEKLSKEMDEKDCGHSYFHSVSDNYENGEHVSHKEKEVKDGKVIKDVGFGVGIEDKSKNENNNDKVEGKEDIESQYKRKMEELCNKIDEKNEIIDKLNARCSKLMKENDKIKFTLRDLIK